MKKTKIGQGRKLLLRGEVVARLGQKDLQLVVGGLQPVEGSFIPPCSHPQSYAIKD